MPMAMTSMSCALSSGTASLSCCAYSHEDRSPKCVKKATKTCAAAQRHCFILAIPPGAHARGQVAVEPCQSFWPREPSRQ